MVVVTTMVTTIIAAVVTLLTTPTYVVTTTLGFATAYTGTVDYIRYDLSYADRLMNTYSIIATSRPVLAELRQRLDLQELPRVEVEIIPNSELMEIKVEDADPNVARDAAAALADIIIAKSGQLYSGSEQTALELLGEQLKQVETELNQARSEYEQLLRNSPDDSVRLAAAGESIVLKERTYAALIEQYEKARVGEVIRTNVVSVIEPPIIPISPAKPNHELNLVLGVLVGFMGGVGLALVYDNLDTRLYTEEQIEAVAQASTVGTIPTAKNKLQIAHTGNGHNLQLEAFRRLRTNILAVNGERLPQSFLVTSAERGEGKSTILANLAVAIARSGQRVVAVDCDLRQPAMHEFFDLPNKRGLTSILTKQVTLDGAIQDSGYQGVKLITSGPLPLNPTELLGSPQMKTLIKQLYQQFDIVLLDTPALLSVTDAAVLAPIVDNVVLVVARAYTRRGALKNVREQLMSVNAKSIEVVVNRAEQYGSSLYYSQPDQV